MKKKKINNGFNIVSFYRFINIVDKKELKKELDRHLKDKLIKGTILLSDEGINGTLSGEKNDVQEVLIKIKKFFNIRKIKQNSSSINFLPFNRMKVRLKKECVSLGKNISLNQSGTLVSPEKWDSVINEKDFIIIDTRNKFEIEIGTFDKALNPMTNSFREFPEKFNKLKIDKKTKIAMFCTGGIRCEKASSYLKGEGYKNVFQLDGGILNYLKFKKKSKSKSQWSGDCFVFDNRVTVNKNLVPGKYIQCFGCRRPIQKKIRLSPFYKQGVSCPSCYDQRTNNQKQKSVVRQYQIDTAEKNKKNHPFKTIYFE